MFTYLVDKTITTHTLAVDRLQNIALHNIVILILTITYDTNKYKVDINTVQDTHYQYCNINITNTEQYDVDTDTITQLPCQYQSSQIHNINVFVWFDAQHCTAAKIRKSRGAYRPVTKTGQSCFLVKI